MDDVLSQAPLPNASQPYEYTSSTLFDFFEEIPSIPTDHLGMIVEDGEGPGLSKPSRRKKQDVKVIRPKRESRKYISKHFLQNQSIAAKLPRRKKNEERKIIKDELPDGAKSRLQDFKEELDLSSNFVQEDGRTDQRSPRIYYGLNVDALSSDSDLTDVPDDIGPDPFLKSRSRSGSLPKVKRKQYKSDPPSLKRHKSATISPYFPAVTHSHRSHFLASLPFPPLSHRTFGLMQERLAHSPFRLLIATIFLNKTPGMRAMPVFYDLMARYPTPEDLADAKVEDVTEMIRMLGFQNQRARKIIAMAKRWVQTPPVKGKRYRKLHYPNKGDGRDVKEDEAIDDQDERVAWEISHLPGLGPYSHDSWRMFCRDKMRGLANDWLGEDAAQVSFEPEWKRVLPMDKELRAWMTWMWLKEGWIWNKETGKLTKAGEDLMSLAKDGGIVQEPKGEDHLIVKGLDDSISSNQISVEVPAGNFIPSIA